MVLSLCWKEISINVGFGPTEKHLSQEQGQNSHKILEILKVKWTQMYGARRLKMQEGIKTIERGKYVEM